MTAISKETVGKIEFLSTLIEKGKLQAVMEPRLSGYPFDKPADLQKQQIALYSDDEALLKRLRGKGITTDAEPVSSSGETPVYMAKLRENLREPFVAAQEQPLEEIASEKRLFRLNLPGNIRMALTRCTADEKDGETLSDVLLLRSRDADNFSAMTSALVNAGLIAKKPPRPYFMQRTSEDGEGALSAVKIPSAIAEAIRRTQQNAIEDFAEYLEEGEEKTAIQDGELRFSEVVALAAAHLEPVEMGKADVHRRARKPEKANLARSSDAKPLEAYTEPFQNAYVSFQHRRRLNGAYTYYVRLKKGSEEVIAQMSARRMCSAPVTFDVDREDDEGVYYKISAADYERLAALVPEEKQRMDVALGCNIPDDYFSVSYDGKEGRDTKITNLTLVNAASGGAYLVLVADSKNRLNAFLKRAAIKDEEPSSFFLTQKNEKPCIMAISISDAIASDIAAQTFSEDVLERVQMDDKRGDPAKSRENLETEMRNLYAVHSFEAKESIKPTSKEERSTETPQEVRERQMAQQQRLCEALQTALSRQQNRDGFLGAVFVNELHEKTLRRFDKKTNSYQTLMLRHVQPALYLRLDEGILDALLEAAKPGHLEYITQLKRDGLSRFLKISFTPDGLQLAKEMFPDVPLLQQNGKVSSQQALGAAFETEEGMQGSAKDCIAIGSASEKVTRYFNRQQKDADFDRELLGLGFVTEADKAMYTRYIQWRKNPDISPKPADADIERIEAALTHYEKEKAVQKALREVASKELMRVDAAELSEQELQAIEKHLARLDGQIETIQGHLTSLQKVSDNVHELSETTEIAQIHPDMTALLLGAGMDGRQAHTLYENMIRKLQEAQGLAEDFRGWLSTLSQERISQRLVVVRATEQTREALKALDETWMTRAPMTLRSALGGGRDAMILFPTALFYEKITALLRERSPSDDEAAARITPLAAKPVRASEILPLLQQQLGVQPEEEPAPKETPKVDAAVVLRKLQQDLLRSRPMLLKERHENPHPNHRAEKPIGEQVLLAFSVGSKSDVKALQNIYNALREAELLKAPSQFGALIDASHLLTAEQRQLNTLREADVTLKDLTKFMNTFYVHLERRLNKSEPNKPFHETAIESMRGRLFSNLRIAKQLSVSLEAVLDDYAAFPDAPDVDVPRNDADYLRLIQWAESYKNALQVVKEKVSATLFNFEAIDTTALDNLGRQQCVSVVQSPVALLDAEGAPIKNLEAHFAQERFVGGALMVKLYVDPALFEEMKALDGKERRRYFTPLPEGSHERALTPEALHALWARAQSGRGR